MAFSPSAAFWWGFSAWALWVSPPAGSDARREVARGVGSTSSTWQVKRNAAAVGLYGSASPRVDAQTERSALHSIGIVIEAQVPPLGLALHGGTG